MLETQQKKSGTWIGITAIVAAAIVAVGAYLWVRRSLPRRRLPSP